MAGAIGGFMRTMRDYADLRATNEQTAGARQTREMRQHDFDLKRRQQEEDDAIRAEGIAAYEEWGGAPSPAYGPSEDGGNIAAAGQGSKEPVARSYPVAPTDGMAKPGDQPAPGLGAATKPTTPGAGRNPLDGYLVGIDRMTQAAMKRGRWDVAGKYWNDGHALRQRLLDEEMNKADRAFATSGDFNVYLGAFNRYGDGGYKIQKLEPAPDGSGNLVAHVEAGPDGKPMQRVLKPGDIQGFLQIMRDPAKFAEMRRQAALKRAEKLSEAESKILEAQGEVAAKGIKVGPNETVYLPDEKGQIKPERALRGPNTTKRYQGVQGNEHNGGFVVDEIGGGVTPISGPAGGLKPRDEKTALKLEKEAGDNVVELLKNPTTGFVATQQGEVAKIRAKAQQLMRESGHTMSTGDAAQKAMEWARRQKELGTNGEASPKDAGGISFFQLR